METSGDFISTCDQDPFIASGKHRETWCYQFDSELKRQSMAWCSSTSPRPKKSLLQKSKVKTLLIAFFDNKGIIHTEFVPAGQTINAAFYQAVLNRLLERIRRVRPELHKTGKWLLLHDNAPAHTAIRVRQFLAQKKVTVLDHPPYSPDLAPVDFLLFPRLKPAIKDALLRTWMPSKIMWQLFCDWFRKLYEHCQTCVVVDGDFFEGQ